MGFWSTFARCGTVFLIAGSALLSLSCKKEKARGNVNPETLITMQSEDLSMTVSKNGLKSYHFTTPLMQQYGLAAEPYTKYPDGVFVQTFQDSTEVVESTLRADEAINYEKRDLWMASGHVVASGSGNTLYTEQLFWDAKTDRVYSNVRVKVVDKDGEHYGEGFESDKDLKSWMFRDYEGTIAVETAPNEECCLRGGIRPREEEHCVRYPLSKRATPVRRMSSGPNPGRRTNVRSKWAR